MVDKIEMSLDDIIKANRQKKSAGRGIGGIRRGVGVQRRGVRRAVLPRRSGIIKGRGAGGIQKAKFSRGDVNSAWKHDMYDGPKRILKSTESAKLIVSNLDYGVSDSDIKELFTEFGPLKKAAVHYDRSGRSLGTADVVFERRADALKAIKQYNGVPLDGRPMNIQFLTSPEANTTRSPRSSPNKRRPQAGPRRGVAGRRGGLSNRGNPAGGIRGRKIAPTAAELDAELDAYVKDMKI